MYKIYKFIKMLNRVFLIISLHLILTQAAEDSTSSTLHYNMYSLSNSQEPIAKAYKDVLISLLDDLEGNVDDIIRYFDVDANGKSIDQDSKKKKLLQLKEECKNATETKDANDTQLFYRMFISTGIQRNHDFGDYKLCKAQNKINGTEKQITKFVVVKEIKKNKDERIVFGACIPYECGDMINQVEGLDVHYDDTVYQVKLFPTENEISKNAAISNIILWSYIGFVGFVILLNILMRFFSEHFNPYDTQEIKLSNSKKKENVLTFVHSRDSRLSASNLDNNNFLLGNNEIDYTISSTRERDNLRNRNPSKVYLPDNSNFDNSHSRNLLSNNNSHSREGDPFNNLNWVKKLYFKYFNISNNLFLLGKVKSFIYNDSKLRYTNGLLLLFAVIHVMSCIFELLRVLSKDRGSSAKSRESSVTVFLDKFITVLGNLYIEILATVWGYFITYKFLNLVQINDKNKSSKLFYWFIKNFEKFIIFIILNLLFLFSFDYIMHKENEDCILWYLYEDKVKTCTAMNFTPFNDFIFLITNKPVTCLNSNRIFFQGVYILAYSFLILSFTINYKKKLQVFVAMLGVTTLLRIVFTIWYLFFKTQGEDIADVNTNKIVDFLHSQFFFNIPNLLLGIIIGHVYYLDLHIIDIAGENLKDYFKGFDKIRSFLVRPVIRNLLYMLSIAIIFYCASTEYFLPDKVKNKWINFILVSINGFLFCFVLSLIILIVKLKTEEMWTFCQIICNISKKMLKSNICLIFARCLFTVNASHTGLIYFILLNLITNSIVFDFFNVVIIYGIPVCILIFAFSFITTLFLEIPIRIAFKNCFKTKKEL
jgi:hypothetical protein